MTSIVCARTSRRVWSIFCVHHERSCASTCYSGRELLVCKHLLLRQRTAVVQAHVTQAESC